MQHQTLSACALNWLRDVVCLSVYVRVARMMCVCARVCVCVCVCEHENMMETGFVLRVCVLAICKNDQQNVKK